MYEDYETKISHDNLAKVIAALPSPVCLVGGWAVYYTVNNNYIVDTGTEYQGSKDIDIGFHIEGDETNELLGESDLAKAVESLKEIGFRIIGMRLFKDYHRETHLLLSEAKAKKTPSYNIFQLYVDILVDNSSNGLKEVTGLTPIDEKLLTHVFKEKMFNAIDGFSTRVILPTPPVLLAMKIRSLPNRTKDHKKYKDIIDVYALIWHSGISIKKLRQDVSNLISSQDMGKMLSSISRSDYAAAADALGIDKRKLESAIKDFVHTPVVASKKSRWPIPSNMSYNGLMMAVKGLSVSGEQKVVDVDVLSKKIGLTTKTVKQGMVFLDSIGVIKRSSRNLYSLTSVGKMYAEAHLSENMEQITQVTLDIINQSHLVELADAIKINKNITRKDLYMRIKAFGGYSDGKGTGNMHGPASSGATTVLRIFEDAGLLNKVIPDKKIDNDRHAIGGASGSHGGGPRPKPGGGKGKHQVRASPLEAAPTNAPDGMNDQAVVALKGVGQVRVNDLETLRVAEMYMDMLRKRLS